MHPYDYMILISIACCVGFTPAIYEDRDWLLVAGYFIASTAGAFAGAFLVLWTLPALGKLGALGGGLVMSVVLVAVWRMVRKRRKKECTDHPGR